MNAPNLLRTSLIGVLMNLMAFCHAEAGGASDAAAAVPVYIGTYTGPGKGQGIYLTHLDPASGTLSPPQVVAETLNPTFLALHPSHKFLFAVNEVMEFDGKKDGSVTGFAIGENGKLTAINQQPSGGTGPCHLSFAPDGKHVLIANYVGGSFEVIPVDGDGKMAEPSCVVQDDKSDPKHEPHGHCIQFDPSGKFVVADDLGLDKIFVFHFDAAKGSLVPNEPPFAETAKGAGPRHLAFHPNGTWAYNINELNSTMNAYAWDAEHGVLKEIDSKSTLSKSFEDSKKHNSCAEVQVHPNGKFVYGSNRGENTIVGFAIDPKTGEIRAATSASSGGKSPRNFAIDPSGNWLLAANQDSGNVVAFKIDPDTGELKPTGQTIAVGAPVCVTFIPR